MQFVYLLGYPLTQSWSPVLQQAAFSHCGVDRCGIGEQP